MRQGGKRTDVERRHGIWSSLGRFKRFKFFVYSRHAHCLPLTLAKQNYFVILHYRSILEVPKFTFLHHMWWG